jgi:lactoylglutathione lyase
MEAQQLHRGRLIDHIQLVVNNLQRSKQFYLAVLHELGLPLGGEGPDFFWVDELFVSEPKSAAAQGVTTGRAHLAFQSPDRATVHRVYEAGLAAGGKDNGKPGERHYHPGYFAAFMLDPDGNNIEIVHHGSAERSAASVTITF